MRQVSQNVQEQVARERQAQREQKAQEAQFWAQQQGSLAHLFMGK